MIEEISIRDLGVIGDARLVFSKGLTAITGETGAGKTMVLSALGLLLGHRANVSTVRIGADQSFVEGRWFLADTGVGVGARVTGMLEEAGIPVEDGELILNRSVSGEGRSKASANGRALPVASITELGEELVVVHGQSDQIRLKSAKAQREALDSFAGAVLGNQLREYKEAFAQLAALRARHASLATGSAERTKRIEDLRAWIAELEKLDAKPGELDRVSQQIEKLDSIEALRLAAGGAHEALSSSGYDDTRDASALVSAARKLLEGAMSSDSSLEPLAERLRELGMQLTDIAADLASYMADLESDAETSIEWLQARKAALVAAGRQHLADPNSLDEKLAELHAELLQIDDSGDSLAALTDELARLEADCWSKAREISVARKATAATLEQEVTLELAGLAMPNARLVVEIEQGNQLTATGIDEVTLMLASFSGAQARPIAKGASGGELSRIMLALEVVLAKGVETPTFIFDEVDAGVGGEAAIEVGRRLARLAQNAQVIVVTHLAQVAAFADRQLRVLKSHAGDVTSSDVVALEGEPRIAELARMISGMADSEAARKNAQELLALARQSV
ncbi:MAG: repair protein RecN [Actinomycetota bacterium]